MRSFMWATPVLLLVQEPASWRLFYEREYKLWSVKEDGSEVRPEDEKPIWHVLSPDGKRRVYESDEGGQGIWIADADGRNSRRLTEKTDLDGSPAWTSDGKNIVFLRFRSGSYQIWIMNSDGTNQIQLTKDKAHVGAPALSPRGDQVAYIEFTLMDHKNKKIKGTLRTMNLKGDDRKELVKDAAIWEFGWDPSGERMSCSIDQEIRVIASRDGKTLQSFALVDIHKDLNAHAASFFTWMPDGGGFACTIRRLGRFDTKEGSDFGDDKVFLLRLTGKPTILLTGRAIPRRWVR